MSSDEARLLATRAEFPTLEKKTHLISHSLGAMPARARKYVEQLMSEWENDSIDAWHLHWLPAVEQLGDLIAQVLGVSPGTVVINQNVSTIQSVVASCFDFSGERNKVVYSDMNFSTVDYVWQEQRRRGADVVVVKSDGIHAPMEGLLAAIDARTLIVPVSHVMFRSSGVKDVHALVKRAHEVGALVMLDTYQSAGTIPLHLEKWGVDLACGGSVKWACGGPGAAYLYVKPEIRDRLRPAQTGWFGHARPFAFEPGPVAYAEDRWRLLGGTPAIPALYTARAGWELLLEVGVEAIRKKSLRQTTMLREMVRERGFHVNTPERDEERGGTIVFDFEGAQDVSTALLGHGMLHDYRPRAGIRASPHYYTTDEELVRFVETIDTLRK
ncbi:MAG: aminotransferase class V-fold PLP-dependent enzyme [Myxococcales bacterium]|nr:aminotransferase class V-fold PLP-dependent enzyme [Myxococcales bacterium]